MSDADQLNNKIFVVSGRKYGVWIIFVVILSAFPILFNITLDFLADRHGIFEWRGVRLMDFLTCGFCLIGGAFCDRFNANKMPSALAFGCSILVMVGAISLYVFVKYSYAAQDELNFYPNDDALVILIMGSYFSALLISLIMLRKTLVNEVVLDRESRLKIFFENLLR